MLLFSELSASRTGSAANLGRYRRIIHQFSYRKTNRW